MGRSNAWGWAIAEEIASGNTGFTPREVKATALDAVQVRAVGEHSCRGRVSQEMRVQNLKEFTYRVGSGWSALGAQLI